jgi:hypothetical protein
VVKTPAADRHLTGLAVFGNMANLFTSVTDMVFVATWRGWWGRWTRGVGRASVGAMAAVEAKRADRDVRVESLTVSGRWGVFIRGVEGVRGVGVIEGMLTGICGLGVGLG